MIGDESQARIVLRRACDSTEDFPSLTRAQSLLAILDVNPNLQVLPTPSSSRKLSQRILRTQLRFLNPPHRGKERRVRGSAKLLQTALKSSPKSTALIMRLAHFYAGRMRDFGKALEHGKLALELAPRDLDIAHSVGRFAREAGIMRALTSSSRNAMRSVRTTLRSCSTSPWPAMAAAGNPKPRKKRSAPLH